MSKNDAAIAKLMANVITGACGDGLHDSCAGHLMGAPCSCGCHKPETKEVGKLNFKGDVRHSQPAIEMHPIHGIIRPSHSEYDEATDMTTIHYEAEVSG